MADYFMSCMIALIVAEQPSTITATAQYSTITRLTVTQPKCKQPGWRFWRCAASERLILLNLKLCLAYQFDSLNINFENQLFANVNLHLSVSRLRKKTEIEIK